MTYNSKDEYKAGFKNITAEGLVKCPLCEHEGKLLSKHMNVVHGIKGVQKFRDMFPEYAICDFETWQRRQQNGYKTVETYGTTFMRERKDRHSVFLSDISSKISFTKDSKTGVIVSEGIVEKPEEPIKSSKPSKRAGSKFSSFEEYSEFYMNIPTEDIVMCPFCDYTGVKLTKHLQSEHNMSSKEFKQKYPEYALLSYKFYKIYSQGAIATLTKYGQSKLTEGKLKSEHFHEVKSKEMIELNQIIHSDPKFCKKVHGPKNGNLVKYYSDVLKKYVFLRSTYELHILEALELANIPYIYEPEAIVYSLDSKKHNYYPDFYIPDYNVIIEAKPSMYCNSEVFNAKKQAVLDRGYNFVQIDETIEFSSEKIIEAIKNPLKHFNKE